MIEQLKKRFNPAYNGEDSILLEYKVKTHIDLVIELLEIRVQRARDTQKSWVGKLEPIARENFRLGIDWGVGAFEELLNEYKQAKKDLSKGAIQSIKPE